MIIATEAERGNLQSSLATLDKQVTDAPVVLRSLEAQKKQNKGASLRSGSWSAVCRPSSVTCRTRWRPSTSNSQDLWIGVSRDLLIAI